MGTPPTSRGVSPKSRRRSSADQRNSVVPFRRSNSASRLADTQTNSTDRSLKLSAPSPSPSQTVPSRQPFVRFSLDAQLERQQQSSRTVQASAKPIDSPFRQEGFATESSHDFDAGSQIVLASVPESPSRSKSKSLLSQQLSSQASALTAADVKVSTAASILTKAFQADFAV